MLKTATLSHTPGDEDRPAHTVVRISDPKRTDLQVQTLLKILDCCDYLLVKKSDIGTTVEVNSKAEEAAAETYALAQAQLRNLIDDQPRWALDASAGDDYIKRLAEAQHSVVKDQKENLELLRKPHRRLNANIQYFPEMNAWIAWIGNGAPTALSLHGIGPSPAEAFFAFDTAYLQRVEKPAAPTKAPKRKKK